MTRNARSIKRSTSILETRSLAKRLAKEGFTTKKALIAEINEFYPSSKYVAESVSQISLEKFKELAGE